jgi:LAO/AO transport system kinase
MIDALLEGNRRALARALTWVENDDDRAQALLNEIYPHTGRAWVIGVTGAPGTGKSSLVNVIAHSFRRREETVGIIAVDPTSPFTGGAILGDRIRMREHAGDAGVFIRSMATRGSLGGLSKATRDGIRVLDAAGFDWIIVETVGAGQSEVDIVRTAQTTVVVEAPGLGDDVQAIKAGIMEIADILVVNKADRSGADQTARTLKAMLELGHPASRTEMIQHHGQILPVEREPEADRPLWIPPVVRTIATDESGVVELIDAIDRHRRYIHTHELGRQLERQRLSIELVERLRETVVARVVQTVPDHHIMRIVDQLLARELAPQQAVDALLTLHDDQKGQLGRPADTQHRETLG